MVKAVSVLSKLNAAKIVVIGDLLLDAYTIGKAKRISPEAPVAIVNVLQEEYRPGGAGNVALNLLSLGVQVVLVGRIGADWAGDTLKKALREENVESYLVTQEAYRTPIKNRIIADNQQIVRLDHEQIIDLNEGLEQTIIERLPSILEGVKAVAISDYGKGFLTSTLLTAIIHHALKCGIPIITDPKGSDFAKYKGTTVIKPNLSEAYAAAHLPPSAPLNHVAAAIIGQTQASLLMITRSEAGISLFDDKGNRQDIPVLVKKEVKDVTGAGDTVLAVLAHAIANQLPYEEAAHLCNTAAGIAIEQVGCARITLSDLALRFFEDKMEDKVFDHEHLFVLQEILKCRSFNLLILSKTEQLSHSLFYAIKNVAKCNENLLIYISDPLTEKTLIEILASIREVDFILFDFESLKSLCQSVSPKATYFFDTTQLIPLDLVNFLNSAHSLSLPNFSSRHAKGK